MGEYAIRNSDGVEIKIGTCEMMYYLRYEDRGKIRALPGNVNPSRDPEHLFFRLPIPEEDGIRPGDYEGHKDAVVRLYRSVPSERGGNYSEDLRATEEMEPGYFQLTHESGLLLSVPCYHGVKLPEVGPSMRAHWNGKSWSLELAWLKAVKESGTVRLLPIVHCRHCGDMWRYSWADVWDYIPGAELRRRLEQYRAAWALAEVK